VLHAVGTVLNEAAGKYGIEAARVGGEKFAMVQVGATVIEAERVLTKICRAIQELAIPHEKSSVAAYVTVSAGLYVCDSKGITSVDAMYTETDHALYEAKRCGRNRCMRYDPLTKLFHDVSTGS
jgi:diguanylate cyclase (GGDEF) domain